MIKNLNRLFTGLLIVTAALYVVILNRGDITIFLTPSNPVTANGGVVLLGAFTLGILCTTAISLFFGIKAWFRERKLLGQERARQVFYDGLLAARSALAGHNHEEAKAAWERIIRKDPTDIIARVELSKAYEQSGDLMQALKVVDAARVADPDNIEVLFRAAELNIALNNKTAAIDNLALILYHGMNRRAAELARDLSEELGRIQDAIEYHGKLSGVVDSRSYDAVSLRLKYKQMMREVESDPQKMTERLHTFVKKHGEFAPALERLAEHYIQAGKADDAAQLLVRAARLSGTPSLWNQAQKLWISGRMPEKAIAAAKSARNDLEGANRINAELELVRTYLTLNMLSDAKSALDALPALMEREGVSQNMELFVRATVLKGIFFFRSGDIRESAALWKELLERELQSKSSPGEGGFLLAGNGPEPHLSTP